VAWVKTCGSVYLMGLRFVNADEEQCRSLGKLIEEAFRSLEKS
jgi:hypothetical protein